jgi:hypothetical protein
MASDHGKLKPLDGGSALNHESHQNKTPIVVAIGVSSPLRCGSTLYQSLRFASAMMLNLTRRVLKKMRIQMRTDTSLIIGEPAYTLKNVEHLYMSRRGGEVTRASDSMVQYHRWRECRDGNDWRSSSILRELRNYNEQDCRSTWGLVEWLRKIQSTSGIPNLPVTGETKKPSEVTTD